VEVQPSIGEPVLGEGLEGTKQEFKKMK
jgi:hypothetical protein